MAIASQPGRRTCCVSNGAPNKRNDGTVARPDNSHTDFWRELPLIGEAIVKFHGLAAPRRIPADHFIHRLRYSFQVSANEEKFFAGLRTEAPPSRH
jgi:hypothetical protein